MKVVVQSIYAKGKVTAQPGDVIDVEKDEAEQLIDGHYAVKYTPAVVKELETAEKPEAETPEKKTTKKAATKEPEKKG